MRSTERRDIALAVVVAVLASIPRLYRLGDLPLDYDEIVTHMASRFSLWELTSSLTAQHHLPPLSYLVLKGTGLFGESPLWLRLPSALIGSATCGAVYLLGRRLIARPEALFAALLLAGSPLHVHQSQTLRAYSLQTFLIVVAALALWRALDRDRLGDWLLLAFASWCAFATHYFSAFALAALAFVALLGLRGVPRDRQLRAVAVGAGALLLALPLAALAIARAGTTYVPFDVFEWSDLGWAFLFETIGVGFRSAGPKGFEHALAAQPAAGFFDAASAGVLLLSGIGLVAMARRERRTAWLVALLVALSVLGPIAAIAGRSFFAHRYATPALPFYLIAVAAGTGALARALSAASGAKSPRAPHVVLAVLAGTLLLFQLRPRVEQLSRIGLIPSLERSHFVSLRRWGVWETAAERLLEDGLREDDLLLVARGPATQSTSTLANRLRTQIQEATLLHYHLERAAEAPVFALEADTVAGVRTDVAVSMVTPDRGWRSLSGNDAIRPLAARQDRVWIVGHEPAGASLLQRASAEGYRVARVERIRRDRRPGAGVALTLWRLDSK